MAKVTIDCETYLKLINGTASEGGTTSGGDYTSSDTSSGQSGSGGGSSKKTSGKNTGGKKNETKSEFDFSCDNICKYQVACRENKLDWRWLAAMDCCDKKIMGKGIADLNSAARMFTKYANQYQSRTSGRYEWKNCYFFGAIAHIMGVQPGGDSADALRIFEAIRNKQQQPTINNLIAAMKDVENLKNNYNAKTGKMEGSKYTQYQRDMFGSYGNCALILFDAIRKRYKKDHYCKPTKLKWGNWDWQNMTLKTES